MKKYFIMSVFFINCLMFFSENKISVKDVTGDNKKLNINKKFFVFPEEIILDTILFVKPDYVLPDSYSEFIIAEVDNVLSDLESKDLIKIYDDDQWKNYKHLLNYEFPSDIGLFFKNTGITGTIEVVIEENLDNVKMSVIINDFVDRKNVKRVFISPDNEIITGIYHVKRFVKSTLDECFKPYNKKSIEKYRFKYLSYIRNNPDFSIFLSIGTGFYFKDSNLSSYNLYSFGFNNYAALEFKLKAFSLRFSASYTPYFHQSPDIAEKSTSMSTLSSLSAVDNYSWGVSGSIMIGGWFNGEVMRIALGGTFAREEAFLKRETLYHREDFFLTFFYLNFSVQPTINTIISVDLGSFISPTNILQILPSPYMPLYFKINFVYVFYKNMFFEVDIPYYCYGYFYENEQRFDEKFYPHLIVNFGLGIRFDWSKND